MDLKYYNTYAKRGDFLLFAQSGLISKLVRYGQSPLTKDGKPSLWSHAVLVYDKNVVIESTIEVHSIWRVDNGIQFTPITKYVHVEPCILVSFPLSTRQRTKVIQQALKLLQEGVTYPICGLIGSLVKYWLLRGMHGNPFQSKNSYYCTAFIQDCYLQVGIDFARSYSTAQTAPELVYQFVMSYPETQVFDLVTGEQLK